MAAAAPKAATQFHLPTPHVRTYNVDAAHADDDETYRSTGGWFFFLRKGQGAVAAKSGQTKDVPLSRLSQKRSGVVTQLCKEHS
jgi:hypothetical protein